MDLWIDGSFMIPAGFDERFLGDVRFELERFFLLMWFFAVCILQKVPLFNFGKAVGCELCRSQD